MSAHALENHIFLLNFSVAQDIRRKLLQQEGVVFRVCRAHTCTSDCEFASESDVYVCKLTGDAHVCGQYCDAQVKTADGNSTCTVTGRQFASELTITYDHLVTSQCVAEDSVLASCNRNNICAKTRKNSGKTHLAKLKLIADDQSEAGRGRRQHYLHSTTAADAETIATHYSHKSAQSAQSQQTQLLHEGLLDDNQREEQQKQKQEQVQETSYGTGRIGSKKKGIKSYCVSVKNLKGQNKSRGGKYGKKHYNHANHANHRMDVDTIAALENHRVRQELDRNAEVLKEEEDDTDAFEVLERIKAEVNKFLCKIQVRTPQAESKQECEEADRMVAELGQACMRVFNVCVRGGTAGCSTTRSAPVKPVVNSRCVNVEDVAVGCLYLAANKDGLRYVFTLWCFGTSVVW